MNKYHYILSFGLFSLLIAFSVSFYRVHTTKDTKHLSYTYFFMAILGQFSLLVYGILNDVKPMYISSTIILLGIIYMLNIKLLYEVEDAIEKELKEKDILS
jgi:uncharacterized protein with PQ loop repeat